MVSVDDAKTAECPSARLPLVKLDAFRLVSPAPFPEKRLAGLFNVNALE